MAHFGSSVTFTFGHHWGLPSPPSLLQPVVLGKAHLFAAVLRMFPCKRKQMTQKTKIHLCTIVRHVRNINLYLYIYMMTLLWKLNANGVIIDSCIIVVIFVYYWWVILISWRKVSISSKPVLQMCFPSDRGVSVCMQRLCLFVSDWNMINIPGS